MRTRLIDCDINLRAIAKNVIIYPVATVIVALSFVVALNGWLPYYFGRLEGLLDADLLLRGRCALENPKATISMGGNKLVIGVIKRKGHKDEPHIWGLNQGVVVDNVCPENKEACKNRIVYATVTITGKGDLVVEKKGEQSNPKMEQILSQGLPRLKGILISQNLISEE